MMCYDMHIKQRCRDCDSSQEPIKSREGNDCKRTRSLYQSTIIGCNFNIDEIQAD